MVARRRGVEEGKIRAKAARSTALLGILGLLVVASPLWLPLLVRRMAFFHVHRVEIVGTHYVAPSDILARLRVDTLSSVGPHRPMC